MVVVLLRSSIHLENSYDDFPGEVPMGAKTPQEHGAAANDVWAESPDALALLALLQRLVERDLQ